MKDMPIRLGPLALLLCVISICLTSLAMLSYADASSDMRLAQRYGQSVKTRYLLEQDGQEHLAQVNNGQSSEIEKEFERDGYRLSVRFRQTAEGYEIDHWKIKKIWNETEDMDDLWEG